jgi:hypothetical protein
MNSRWIERIATWNAKLQNVLRGRYAHFDPLNRALLFFSIVFMVLNIFLQNNFLRVGALIILGLVYYRFFSKRIYVRSNENTKFLAFQKSILNKITFFRQRFHQRKTYRYFTCPNCHQSLRAPRGRGKIKVTCSSCREQFIKKV